MPDLFAYTDGACSGNPGPGGWGAILRFGDKIHDDACRLWHRIDESHHLFGRKRALGFAGRANRDGNAVFAYRHVRIGIARIVDRHDMLQ